MKCFKSAMLSLAMLLPLVTVGDVWAEDEAKNDENVLAVSVRDTSPLIGAWLVTLTNGATKLKNPALYSFLPGGVLHQSETPMTDPMLNNLVFSNAHGAWEYNAEDDSYVIRYFKLSYWSDASFAGQEETTGKLKIDEKGNLSGSISVGNTESVFTGARITATVETK